MDKYKIIAEIGWNHMGSVDLAKKMIDAAVGSGADYCKISNMEGKIFKRWSLE